MRTGVMHQIRVHLAAIGHPIASDRMYGIGDKAPGLARQFLHASRLELVHPTGAVRLELAAELPADLCGALEILGIKS